MRKPAPAYSRATEKRNSIENSRRFEKKCSAEVMIRVSPPIENQKAGLVTGKFMRSPSQVETREKSGILLISQKLFPF